MLAFAKSDGPGLHHSSWDVATHRRRRARHASRWATHGYTHGWGVGRHVHRLELFPLRARSVGQLRRVLARHRLHPGRRRLAARPTIRRRIRSTSGGRRSPDDFIQSTTKAASARDAAHDDATGSIATDQQGGASHERRHAPIRRCSSRPLLAASAPALRAAPSGPPITHRQHARADRAARRDRASCTRSSARSTSTQLNKRRRPARPAGRVDRQGRPVEARPRAHALRAAHHRRQGRSADGAVRDRRDPVGDGRRAALQQDAHPPHVRHPEPRQVRHAVPDVVARARSARTRSRTRCSTRWPRRRKPPKTIAVVTSKFPSVHFMSLGAREVAKKRGAQGSAVPRMGVRQPRLRPDRRAHQGRQSRLPLGRRDRPRGQPAARRDEEDRLHAAGSTSTCIRRRGRWRSRRRRRTRSPATIFEEHPPFTNNPGAAEFVKALQRARGEGRACPYTAVETQAAASYTAWQVLEAAVTATKSLDDKVLADWLQQEPGRHDPGQAALRRPEQLRRRPDAREAGAERPLGRRVAEGRRGARARRCMRDRDAGAMTLPERDAARAVGAVRRLHRRAVRAARARASACRGGCCGQINLAHFALAFLAAYLCYQLSTRRRHRSAR